MNHTTVIGPKYLAMCVVPRDCTANKPTRMMTDRGMTYWPKAGETSFKPSTADSTEIAGVMTASP